MINFELIMSAHFFLAHNIYSIKNSCYQDDQSLRSLILALFKESSVKI